MKILVLKGKYSPSYFDVSTQEKLLATMRYIFDMNSWMYSDEEDPVVKKHIELAKIGDDLSAGFVVADRSRSGCEYETYQIHNAIDAQSEKWEGW